MDRSGKEQVVARLHEQFQRATVFILAGYSGMQVNEIQDVKNALRKADGAFKVVKNRLAARAAVGTFLEPVSRHLKGPVALVIGFHDVVAPVKVFNGLMGQQAKLIFKVGVVEGRILDRAGVQFVATLPPKKEMLGQLAVRMKSPLYGLAGTLGGLFGKFARVLNAVCESRTA